MPTTAGHFPRRRLASTTEKYVASVSMLKLTDQTAAFTAYCLEMLSFKTFVCFPHAWLTPYMQGLVLGVFEEEGNVQLSEAAARFDQTLSGKLSELLKM